jgi:hypothetical protein
MGCVSPSSGGARRYAVCGGGLTFGPGDNRYELVATAVFTPIEYGSVGVSEDSVREPLPGVTAADKSYTPVLSQT